MICPSCHTENEEFTAKDVRADRMLFLKHGEPMIFGKNSDKGIRLSGLKPEVVELGKDGVTDPEYPVPVGVIRAVQRPTYEALMDEQIERAIATQGEGDLEALLRQGDTWEVA